MQSWIGLWLRWNSVSLTIHPSISTPLKTNSSHLKMDGWKMKSPFEMVPFQMTCSFSGVGGYLQKKQCKLSLRYCQSTLANVFCGYIIQKSTFWPLDPWQCSYQETAIASFFPEGEKSPSTSYFELSILLDCFVGQVFYAFRKKGRLNYRRKRV